MLILLPFLWKIICWSYVAFSNLKIVQKFIHCEFYNKTIFNLTPRSSAHSFNTRFNTDLSLSHVRTNLAANFVSHQGVKIFNNLPNYLKHINDFQNFKRTKKSYLLNTSLWCSSLWYNFLYVLIFARYYSTVSHQTVSIWFWLSSLQVFQHLNLLSYVLITQLLHSFF